MAPFLTAAAATARMAGASTEVTPTDTFVPSAPPSDATEKSRVIREMIRKAPGEQARQSVVDALSAYPLKALEIVNAYGTKIEVFDFQNGDTVPEYLPTLAYGNVMGAYNTKANVLGLDVRDANFPLLHEFAHALDAALNEESATPEWKGAHSLAANTNRVVRDYAKQDPSEYLAEVTTAYLVPDDALYGRIEAGLASGAHGMDERDYMRMYQSMSKERLERLDPDGHALVADLLEQRIYEGNLANPQPAMTAEQWIAFTEAQHAKGELALP
ncbi:MAG: hypothetical protein FJX76_01600 [Armatimonadetes bacterium]|nr:hypothetical protein [Armatimonadota bacterium]